MRYLLPLSFVALLGTLAFGFYQPEYNFGAPTNSVRLERSINPETDSKWELGTSTLAWLRVFTDELCLNADCKTAWPGGSSAFPFTPQTNYGTTTVATSTVIWGKYGLHASSTSHFDNATSTFQTILTSLWLPTLTSALLQTDANGLTAEYAGAGCTNQVVEDISALGATTCVSIESEQLGDDDWGDITITTNVAAVEDDSHAHTGTTISSLDISDDTNLTAGDHLTLTNDDLDVDDDFILNTGDVGTGSYTFPDLNATRSTTTSATTTNFTVTGWVSILGEAFTNFTTYVRSLFTGGTGIAISSGDIAFDCSEVEGTGINCSGENITLDATGDWTGTLDGTEGTNFALVGGDTYTGTHDFSGATVKQHLYASFTYATSTAWTGTTTIPLGPAYTAESWSGAKCFTDAGTVWVSFGDGTNQMDNIQASTTVGTNTLTTNNTFTASEKRFVNVGTPASSPTKISCTVDRIVNN